MVSPGERKTTRKLWDHYRVAAEQLRHACEKLGLAPVLVWGRRLLAIVLLPVFLPYLVVRMFSVTRRLESRSRPLPTPGVVYGDGFLAKRLLYGDPLLGDVLILKPWTSASDNKESLLCAGSRGAVIITQDSLVVRRTLFPELAQKVLVIGSASHPCFLVLDHTRDSVSLYDVEGHGLWSYVLRIGINDIAVGDLNDDGSPECLIAANAGGGLHAVNLLGQRLWKVRGGNLWCVAISDAEAKDSVRVYHSHANGRLFIRDRHGGLLKAAKAPWYLGDFCLCNWPNRRSPTCILGLTSDEGLFILDAEGETILLLYAPEAMYNSYVQATNVRFLSDQADYLAVLLNCPSEGRSMLFVYSDGGDLTYVEALPHSGAGLMSRQSPDACQETLLVGGAGRIWEYRATACHGVPTAPPPLRVLK